jgi:osmotically-inducible protein OsmY
MRRFFLGLAIASLTASVPVTAFGGDREIADQIIQILKQQQAKGSLKGFDIDLNVEEGIVTLLGSVANGSQAASVIEAAHAATGVKQVVSNIEIRSLKPIEEKAVSTRLHANADSHIKQVAGEDDGAPAPLSIGGFETSKEVPSLIPPTVPQLEVSKPVVSTHDAAITESALARLGQYKSNGQLKHFDLDLSTVDGEVWVRGHVANAAQKNLVLQTVQRVPGVTKVIDDLNTKEAGSASPVKPASDTRSVSAPSNMPIMGKAIPVPRAHSPSMLASYDGAIPVEGVTASSGISPMPTPMPMNMGPSYGAGAPRYDQPQMPGYAWPSYAAYPNSAAVTYPKQYSASAWPYIGPFYPYPQVPLGWRKVALEWDDGLWYLDFTSK